MSGKEREKRFFFFFFHLDGKLLISVCPDGQHLKSKKKKTINLVAAYANPCASIH